MRRVILSVNPGQFLKASSLIHSPFQVNAAVCLQGDAGECSGDAGQGDAAKPLAAKADDGRPSYCDIRGVTSISDAFL